MKANELMIGDFIYQHHPKDNTQHIVKVSTDTLDLMYRMEIGFIQEQSPLYRIIEPIPLTPEILEKNGWEYNNYNNETENEEEYYVDENGFDIHINGKKFEVRCIDAVNIQLKYIHELQHALKLCGIEKTIEL